MSMRGTLKGTKIYLDNDLTFMQQEQKKESMMSNGSKRCKQMGCLQRWQSDHPGENGTKKRGHRCTRDRGFMTVSDSRDEWL